ncbi:glycerophosphodiester phosphodiesterase [Clostridium sp. MSJ-11]|uniref:Glycerophosphodiester phosphodiesterase n=1 Tax=Clostridium mobile TaxID=2841512 RepID=A0ABS6EJ41_9CLOT|nr:glycerophosphodiester phosphodiesterase [Clostridium mobile]MBU5485235.1 glycerophosphodiester phosphodiesterase [Clostridium mobile]
MKNPFLNEIKALNNFRYGLKNFIKYQIVTKLLLSIIILPISSFIINILMSRRGFYIITNDEILKYGFSMEGILTLLTLYIMSTLIILLEIGGLIVISNETLSNRKESDFYSILKFCLKKTPKFIGVGGIFAILFFFIFTRFIGIESYTSLGFSFKIPYFIQSFIDEYIFLSAMEALILIILFIKSIELIFSFHFIILDNKKPMKALRASRKLIKDNRKKFLTYFLAITILHIILFLLIYMSWISIMAALVRKVNYNSYLGRIIISSIFVFHQMGTMISSFVVAPLGVYYITRLFYILKQRNNEIQVAPLNIKIKERPGLLDKIFSNKRRILVAFISVFLGFTIITSFIVSEIINIKYDVKITAHRGAVKEAPENTLSSIEAAIKHNADFAEIDAQESKDGEVVLLHDSNLRRTTGLNKNIWEITYNEIKELDAGSYFDKRFSNERIPLLDEAIKLSKDKIKLNIEIKTNGHEKNLVKNVVKIIEENDFIDSCVITSLDYKVLEEVKEINPKIKRGYIIFLIKGDLKKLDVDFYSIEQSIVNDDIIYTAHSMGREVHVWTVNNSINVKRLVNLGVDNIITDDVVMVKYILNEMKKISPYEKFFNNIINIQGKLK